MRPRVNLVALILTLAVLASALDPLSLEPAWKKSENRTSSSGARDGHPVGKSKRPVTPKIRRPAVTAAGSIASENAIAVKKNGRKAIKATKGVVKVADNNKLALIHDLSKKTGIATKNRETRRRRRTMNRAMIALLMAYKLKFATLVPTLLGGLILLIGNTALAGFFFALFAAVLGLKH